MKRTNLGGGRSTGADRISELPDEIIHEILQRLKYSQTTLALSRRWLQIWLSYPILEFHCHKSCKYSAKLKSFVAAAARKLSSSQHNRIKALRISSYCSDFISDMLDLIVNREPEEIVVKCYCGIWYELLPTQLINNPRLRILDLRHCSFWEFPDTNHLDMRMINLRVLHLEQFIINEGVLNCLIASSPLLEELKLCYPRAITIRRLYICNNPNLKILELEHCPVQELIQVAGTTKSLERMSLTCSDLDISPSALSSLKSLQINNLTGECINNLIANSPSLQSLCLYHIGKVEELEIRSHTLQKLDLGCSLHQIRLLIDAPRLVIVEYQEYMTSLPAITHPANLQEAQPCTFTVYLSLQPGIVIDHFIKLKDFLAKLRHQFQFVRLVFGDSISFYEDVLDWHQVEDCSSIPMIQHVKFEVELSRLQDNDSFLSSLFMSCHPNYLCLIHKKSRNECPYDLRYMTEFFMNRNCNNCCKSGYKCWHHQVKDVKIVSGKKDEGDEQLSEISNYVDWTCTDEEIVWLKLIWHSTGM